MVLYAKGWSIKDIAAALGRPYKATKLKIEYERSRGEDSPMKSSSAWLLCVKAA
jgi:hypothetical protein